MDRLFYHGYNRVNSYHYRLWSNMKRRCSNPRAKDFERYGARGITVCDKWKESFLDFKEDVGERPTDKHSLDRIDNNGNYEPGNVKWSTRFQQQRNRRNNRFRKWDIARVKCLSLTLPQTWIAEAFSVHPADISNIINGKRWREA